MFRTPLPNRAWAVLFGECAIITGITSNMKRPWRGLTKLSLRLKGDQGLSDPNALVASYRYLPARTIEGAANH